MFGTSSKPPQPDDEEDSNSDEEENEKAGGDEEPAMEAATTETGDDEFKFNDYDKEKTEPALKMSDVVEVTEDDQIADNEDDSDAEDEIIKPSDNLVLVGRVEADCSSLEVFVYNDDENSLYVHHDFVLPFHLLCVEPFSYDPGSSQEGNLCAIGGMEPIIHIYDLDIHQPLEPIMVLGKKANKKKNVKRVGHKTSVLDLAWNSNYQHIMASASVDQTVILWDLEHGTPSTVLKDFAEKAQSIQFNPVEAEYLLAGSSDNTVKLFDCRQSDNERAQYKQWIVEGEVEKVKWNPSDKYCFVVGTNGGKVYYFDSRSSAEPLWTIEAHEKEVTDFGFNKLAPNMLSTTSVDSFIKIWKFDASSASLVHAQHYKLGRIHCLHEAPENNWMVGLGGDKRKKNFMVANLLDLDPVKKAFTDLPVSAVPEEVTMEADDD